MEEFLKVAKAISDANRVKILKMIQRRVMCVCEIQAALGIAQSTASKHLKVLERAGLIRSYKEGLWVNYQVENGEQSPYAASLLGNLRHWLEDDPDIQNLVKRLDEIKREDVCKT